MTRGSETFPIAFSSHIKRAKRRSLGISISNAKGSGERRRLYRDLVTVTKQSLDDATRFLARLKDWKTTTLRQDFFRLALSIELKKFIERTGKVIDQTERRVFHGESVPSRKKLVSSFEVHTDIIEKSGRETEYSHKVCLTTGESALILDGVVLDGNPADSGR